MSNQSQKIGPELDRENAHFSVSEAMIAAIEEVSLSWLHYLVTWLQISLSKRFTIRVKTKFYKWVDSKEEEEDDQLIRSDINEESDEEIRQVKLDLQLVFGEKNFGNDKQLIVIVIHNIKVIFWFCL